MLTVFLIGTNSSFRTDAAISGASSRGERELQRWVPEGGADVDLSLESDGRTGWDQFETNNRLFGANSTYDENLYTTQIDRSAPSYLRREAEAARIARDIERTSSTNTHLQEERGQALENDGEDEEDKYSGVRRDDFNFPPLSSGAPNKYTPPARRAPTGQPTVAGVPVDPAIISAQVAKPENQSLQATKPSTKEDSAANVPVVVKNGLPEEDATPAESRTVENTVKVTEDLRSVDTSASPRRREQREGTTEGIENQLLSAFHQFKDNEKLKYEEVRRLKAKSERTSKLNDLLRFSKTFKLKTPVPTDLVGILAKDPAKQEQIVEKAQKDHEEQISGALSPASHSSSVGEAKTPSRPAGVAKFDTSTIPSVTERQLPGRGRQGYPTFTVRNDRATQQQTIFGGRGASGFSTHRSGALQQDRKSILPPTIPQPIPIPVLESRPPPSGPAADQSGLTSPQRSIAHTPTSAVSSKFNVKAMEFKPNAAAPAFNPSAVSNPPSSPMSKERTRSVSRAPSPSEFFGLRKPKSSADRASIGDSFNPIERMKKEVVEQKEQHKKDYSSNGGIPNAYQTTPVWEVKEENKEKSYVEIFEKTSIPHASPARSSRSTSAQQIPYHQQVPAQLQNGLAGTSHISVPHHGAPNSHVQHHTPHLEDPHHLRMQLSASNPPVYPSPRLPSGQMVFASPMGHPAQLAYGQPVQQYFTAQGGPAPMQVRQYTGTPQFMHSQGGQLAAPMMIQQQSSGPYLTMPQQYNPQMQMYSPNPGHVYPQHVTQQSHSGYPSPGRGAPMMMHQGSQQGHHPGQPVMYAVPNQPGQMGYPQQGGHLMRGTYPGQQGPYGSSPHQTHHFPPQNHRMPSNGYQQLPQKMMAQQMQPGVAPPPNAPHQPAAYAAEGPEEGK